MEVKIDTKEKFTVVTPIEASNSANIAATLIPICKNLLHRPIKNLVLNMETVNTVDQDFVKQLMELQEQFYENSASFVICNLTKSVNTQLEALGIEEMLNITPTESEAWDIVQMEEIERELLDGDDINFETSPS
jgi:anti-anti-sigma regulatory factor